MMHICVSKLTITGWDNGLSPGQRQATILTNARILLIRTLGTNFSEILSEIRAFSFKKMHLEKWRPSCLDLNMLICYILFMVIAAKRHYKFVLSFFILQVYKLFYLLYYWHQSIIHILQLTSIYSAVPLKCGQPSRISSQHLICLMGKLWDICSEF